MAAGLVSTAGKIRRDNLDLAPLLLIGGGIDIIAQSEMTQAFFKKQKPAPSTTELRISPPLLALDLHSGRLGGGRGLRPLGCVERPPC